WPGRSGPLRVGLSPLDECPGVFGVEVECGGEVGDGVVVPACLPMGYTPQCDWIVLLRSEKNCLVEVVHGLLIPPGFSMEAASVGEYPGADRAGNRTVGQNGREAGDGCVLFRSGLQEAVRPDPEGGIGAVPGGLTQDIGPLTQERRIPPCSVSQIAQYFAEGGVRGSTEAVVGPPRSVAPPPLVSPPHPCRQSPYPPRRAIHSVVSSSSTAVSCTPCASASRPWSSRQRWGELVRIRCSMLARTTAWYCL
ncbi:hypothetical protein GA0115246_113344, partial [Streptomyces sp. SolWspMP-sol7th]